MHWSKEYVTYEEGLEWTFLEFPAWSCPEETAIHQARAWRNYRDRDKWAQAEGVFKPIRESS